MRVVLLALSLLLLPVVAWSTHVFNCIVPGACPAAEEAGPQVLPMTPAAGAITPDIATADVVIDLVGLAEPLRIYAPTGSPRDMASLRFRITSTVSVPLAWDPIYQAKSRVPLPSATSGKDVVDYVQFFYNGSSKTWHVVATTIGIAESAR